MAIRLHEVHPTLVHFPLALVPLSFTLDILGRATHSRPLMNAGRMLMPVAAMSGVVAGIAGLIAQQSVRAEGEARAALITHRNMNLTLVALTGALAAVRARRERPGLGYLLTGVTGFLAMNYSAYLGGKMVYTHGVGIESAGGLETGMSPELRRGQFGPAARIALRNVASGFARVARELRGGQVMPLLQRGRGRRGDGLDVVQEAAGSAAQGPLPMRTPESPFAE